MRPSGLKLFLMMAVFLGMLSLRFLAFADDRFMPIADLIEEANSIDHREVMVKGEVIGDVMNRGAYTWINIEDKSGQMGLWVPRELADKVEHAGDYHYRGDVIEVSGEFRRADTALGGEMVIYVNVLTIAERGFKIEHFESNKKKETLLLLILCVTVIILLSHLRYKRKEKLKRKAS